MRLHCCLLCTHSAKSEDADRDVACRIRRPAADVMIHTAARAAIGSLARAHLHSARTLPHSGARTYGPSHTHPIIRGYLHRSPSAITPLRARAPPPRRYSTKHTRSISHHHIRRRPPAGVTDRWRLLGARHSTWGGEPSHAHARQHGQHAYYKRGLGGARPIAQKLASADSIWAAAVCSFSATVHSWSSSEGV